MPAVFLKEIF